MTFDDFIRESYPIVYEIVCECIEMSAEEYEKYKAGLNAELTNLNKTWIMNFFREVFNLVESYRSKAGREEAATCKN